MSNAVTTAPRRREVAIACRPATPAPSTSTWAGGIVPAAVISIGEKRGISWAAMITAREPLTGACEDSASIDWAREMRGIASIAKAVAPVAAIALAGPFAPSGLRKPISTDCLPSLEISPSRGGATLATTSAFQASSAETSFTPAASSVPSGMAADSPAPFSTSTSCPAALSLRATSGTMATRRSPSAVSLGIPILIGRGTVYERAFSKQDRGREPGDRARAPGGAAQVGRRVLIDPARGGLPCRGTGRPGGRGRRRRGGGGRHRGAGDPGDRQRFACERLERLAGDPDRRLRARAGVADGAVRPDQRAQVGRRGARARMADVVRVAVHGQQALDGPGRRLRVRAGAGHERVAAVGVLGSDQEPRGPADGRRRAPAGRDEGLDGGAGVVDARSAAAFGEVEAAVGV